MLAESTFWSPVSGASDDRTPSTGPTLDRPSTSFGAKERCGPKKDSWVDTTELFANIHYGSPTRQDITRKFSMKKVTST